MSTQKVRPDRGFTERQEFRQRRQVRNQKIGAYVVVAAVAAVAVVAFAAVRGGQGDTSRPRIIRSAVRCGPACHPLVPRHRHRRALGPWQQT